ncbi:MAG TPA: ribose-5-phosphate isomerase, partial [Actinobacteria bacterium]|nr:ribose-5-phosphate isomerase [Actinomycetota bacterium]
MKVVMGSDHAGVEYKEKLKELALSMGHQIMDIGTNSSKSADYPDFGEKGALAV